MYEAIIFDLDGTLLDTLDDLTDAVNAALEKYGYKTRTREDVRSFIGNGIVKLIERALGGKTDDFALVLKEFKTYYGVHCADKTQPYEGVMALLQVLREKGIKTAVLSNKADFAVKTLAETYFGDLLMAAVGENEEAGIRKKPAPDALFAVMKELGVSKETTVYVGDSEVDIQTAQNAGIPCISVTWGFKDKDFLLQNGGTTFADEPLELLSVCGVI